MTKGDAALAALEARIGYAFRDRGILRLALTHSSLSASRSADANNERLEFLGDRVLGLIIAEMLMGAIPEALEGELSRRLAFLVRWETCAAVAADAGIGAALRYGAGTGSATALMLSDACEALIGALYRDGGLEAARAFVGRYWQDRLATSLGSRDAKSALQEWAQGRGLAVPRYEIIERSGPQHQLHFVVEARIDGFDPARGKGRTRREAEQDAATAVLMRQGLWPEVGNA
ncbi:MAG: ribonuclease III [Rhizobiales bacterium]|nr:ribonuclease III [Hyphomicrobiales bacterium]